MVDCLVACGYQQGLKSLFLWEGVTIYIDPGAVDDIMTFVAGNSGPGSDTDTLHHACHRVYWIDR